MQNYVQGYWNTNLGDDLFLKILCDRYPEQKFSTYMTEKNATVFEGLSNLEILHLKLSRFDQVAYRVCYHLLEKNIPYWVIGKIYPNINEIQNVIEIGGSIFIMPKNVKDGGINLRKRKYLQKNSESYVILGSNFGPFDNEKQLKEYSNFFDTVSNICFRDKYSFDLFRGKYNVTYAPDIVLTLNTNEIEATSVEKPQNDNYSLFSIIDPEKKLRNPSIEKKQNYIKKILSEINKVKNNGSRIILFSFCDAEGDRKMCEYIYNLLDAETKKFVSIKSHNNLAGSLSFIKNCNSIVASRYHAMILGWVFRKPTFVISYSKKTVDVIQEFFPEQKYYDLNKNNLNNKSEEFNVIDKSVLSSLQVKAEKQFNYLDKLFRN